MKKPKAKQDPSGYNEVHLYDAKPNKMFPDWMTVPMRFLKFHLPVPCAACGKMSKNKWTMLMSFKVVLWPKPGDARIFVTPESKIYLPLTPVCTDHPLTPIMPPEKKGKKNG